MNRNREILEHKINQCNELIANLIFHNLSQKKIDKITVKRDRYQQQLDELN